MNSSGLTIAFFLLTTLSITAVTAEEIEILHVPNGGIQPQAVADKQGIVHLIYYKGERANGNLFYVTRSSGGSKWSAPLQVNSTDGSANRNEAISRAQLAIDNEGLVHVVWFNMRPAKYWYTRKESSDQGFEKQRNLVSRYNRGVETGASVGVDGQGGVFVIWHAGDMAHEDMRAVYITRSTDKGKTFTREERVSPDDTGACACCGLKTMVDEQGAIYVSYRSAGENIHRNMVLLKSTDSAQSFTSEIVHEWELQACPVSTTTIARGPQGSAVAWETKGQVYFASVNHLAGVRSVPGESVKRRKNPAMAIDAQGNTLIAWAEGVGFQSGGQLHWQLFNAQGKVTEAKGELNETMPDFSSPEVVAKPDGGFVIIY